MSELRDIDEGLITASNITTNYIEGLVASGVKYLSSSNIDVGPGLLPSKSRDIDYFFELTRLSLIDYHNRKKTVAHERIELVQDSPPVDAVTEKITCRLISRCPAKAGSNKVDSSNGGDTGREFQPRARYIKEDASRPGQKVIVMGQFFDNVVEFKCWARSNKVADNTALWFQDFMNIYRFHFKLRGISEVLFLERLEDMELEEKTVGNWLKCRPLRYKVRTDRTFEILEWELRDIVLNLGLGLE